MFEYSATVERVVDADTFLVLIDLGFHVFTRQRVRLQNVYTPESNTPEGKRATAFVRALVEGKEVTVITHHDRQERYGRYLADVWLGDVRLGGVDINTRVQEFVGEPQGQGAGKEKTKSR